MCGYGNNRFKTFTVHETHNNWLYYVQVFKNCSHTESISLFYLFVSTYQTEFKMGFAKVKLAIIVITSLLRIVTSTSRSFNLRKAATVSRHSHHASGNYSCPEWAYYNQTSGDCKCSTPSGSLTCDSNEKKYYIFVCYCLTYNKAQSVAEIGPCLYNCAHIGRKECSLYTTYCKIPRSISKLEHAMCGAYNRTGTLCGDCLNGTHIRAYSFDMSCYSCGSELRSWVKYIAVAFLPLTFFCLAIVLFRVNIASELMGYVFFCQTLASPMFARSVQFYFGYLPKHNFLRIFIQLMGTLYGIWNLDYFRPIDLGICFEYRSLTILSLDIFVALYPLVIMAILYAITVMHDSNWRIVVTILKPLKTLFTLFKIRWNIRTSAISAFANYMFLSNSKFLSTCFDLLAPVQVCSVATVNTTCRWAAFYDPSLGYLSRAHLPYAGLAWAIFILFVLTPLLILVLYPLALFQKCISVLPQRWRIALHYFVDSFQGCYRDGTEPLGKDCRWFSAVPFVLRLVILLTYSEVFYYYSFFGRIIVLCLVLTAIVTIIVEPHKAQFKRHSDHFAVFLLSLAIILACKQELDYKSNLTGTIYALIVLTCTVHQIYIFIMVFFWIKKWCYRFVDSHVW